MEVNKIYQGHALEVLKQLPDKSVNCVMTSPPYWALRAYKTEPQIWDGNASCEHEWGAEIKTNRHKQGETNPGKEAWYKEKGEINQFAGTFCQKCPAWKGELGLEPDFNLYIKHLCDIFDEVKRVLAGGGTVFINIGDTYGGSLQGWGASAPSKSGFQKPAGLDERYFAGQPASAKTMPKSLIMIPFRFAIEMCNRGWILRNTIIWHKRNCMPSSAKDRFTVDFEYVYFFVKSKKYYFEQQFESYSDAFKRDSRFNPGSKQHRSYNWKSIDGGGVQRGGYKQGAIEGRNMRCIWDIPPRPFKEAHFAVFPEALCETPIKAACPEFVCMNCGKPREKLFAQESFITRPTTGNPSQKHKQQPENSAGLARTGGHVAVKTKQIGYSDCGCQTGFGHGIVLDPFAGSGTTCVVARKLNRNFIGIELQPKYIEIAEKRLAPLMAQQKLSEVRV